MQQVFIVRTVYFNQLVTMPLHSSCRLCLRYMSRTQLATYKAWKTCHLHTHANIDGWSLYRPELFLERGGWAVLGIACGRVSNVSCVQPYPWQKEWGDVKSGFKNNTPAMHNLLRLWVFSVLFHRDRSSWGKIWCIRPVPMRITSKQYPRVFLLGQVFDDDATILFGFWYLLVKDSKTIKNNQKQSKKHQIKTSCTHLAVNILWVLKSPATFTAVNATRPASETALGVRLTSQLRWSKIRRSKRCWQHQYKLAKLRQSMIIAAKHAMFVILCTSSSAMPYECHMVSLQGSFADDSLIYESLLCLLVSFESFAIICMSSIGLPLGHQYTRALTSAKFVQNQNRSNSRHL